MRKKPLISVIIPFGRQEARFLFRAITSLFNQDYKNVEIILADYSGSTDFGKFDKTRFPVRHIKITKERCRATAANVGAKRSKGKFLLFCAANAQYKPKYISSLYKKIGSVDVAYSWFDQINIHKGGIVPVETPMWRVLDFKRDRDFAPQSIMIKRDKFLWFDPKVKHFANWDLILNLRGNGRTGAVLTKSMFDYYYTPIAYDLTQALASALVRKYERGKEKEFDGVAVIIENQSTFSGGRYHTWMHAVMMAEAGHNVKIYTNRLPVFKDDFLFYKSPKIELVSDLAHLDVKAKLYYGSPFLGTYVGMRLAKKYRRNVICQIFDPPHWLERMTPKKRLPPEMVGPNQIKKQAKNLRIGKQMYISVSCKSAVKGTAKWFGIPESRVLVLPPYINNRALETIKSRKKEKWVMAVSRSVARKSWGETLQVFRKSGLIKKGYKMRIITDDPTDIERKANEIGIAKHIEFHVGISDLEKFWLMECSEAVLSTSRFEGYGMWAMEGEETGLPVICYSLPPIREIKNTVGDDTIIFTAKVGDVNTLADELRRNVDIRYTQDKGIFGMDNNLDTIKETVDRLL